MKTIKTYCSACKHPTKHEILFETKDYYSNEDFWEETIYQTVKCLGCDHISFRTETQGDAYMQYYGDGEIEMEPDVAVYPDKSTDIHPLSTWHVPSDVAQIYLETVTCLNNNCHRLAAAGCRAIVEAICNQENIKGKNLEGKINALKTNGIITKSDRDKLHAVRFMGNDSIHQMKAPDRAELMIVFEIVQSMIDKIYILEQKFRQLHVKPIKTINEFIDLLTDELAANHKSGEINILKNLLPTDSRIIKEDLPDFEKQLQQKIVDGSFTLLSLCPAPTPPHKQQYKVM